MTGLTRGANFLKYMLFFFNFLFVITGIILLSIGLAVQGVYFGYEHFLDNKFFSIPAFLIAIGIIIFFIAFFGCCGAYKENYCMIVTFSGLLILVFILELAAGISGYVLRNQTLDLINNSLSPTMDLYTNKSHPEVAKVWDEMQIDFNCCGLKNQTDWIERIKATPLSCCEPIVGETNTTICNENSPNLRKMGCVEGFGNYIRAHAVSLGAAGIALAVIQFIGIFVAVYIAKQIKLKSGHTGFN